jgi:RNA polymerase sigma factor (sigma-70 family)
MTDEEMCLELIVNAQGGDAPSADRLIAMVKDKVCAYIFRLTLDYHLCQDLSQDTLLVLAQSLAAKRLRFDLPNQFWAWLFRTAHGKIQHHFRNRHKQIEHMSETDYDDLLKCISDDHPDGLDLLIRRELAETVVKAMKKLKLSHRNVLSLHCFEQMSYADIASMLDCSELRVRVLFFRAKSSLKRQLASQGFKKTLFLVALGLFGKITTPAHAAAPTVTAASVKTGFGTAAAAYLGTKIGISLVAAAALATGGISVWQTRQLPQRTDVRSIYFCEQRGEYKPNAPSNFSNGTYEQAYYFPDGIDGTLFMWMQRWDSKQQNPLCRWLQNGQANYYYHSGEKKVYVRNGPLWGIRRTVFLPSDPSEMVDFLDQVEGEKTGMIYRRDSHSGLYVEADDDRFVDAHHFQTRYVYNTLKEDDFRYMWGPEVAVIDQRDPMHQRGWTYFRIAGNLGDQEVLGRGCMPLVHGLAKEHPPWLWLDIGSRQKIVDGVQGAWAVGADDGMIERYPAGTFFQGLNRPWLGLHAIDIVRRDAARRQWSFKKEMIGNFDRDSGYQRARITITAGKIRLAYLINMKQNLIESIVWVTEATEGTKDGMLQFLYPADIESANEKFVEPVMAEQGKAMPEKTFASFWMVRFIEGSQTLKP